jgi:DNA processing protein
VTALDDADRAALVALVALPGVGPSRIRAMCTDRSPLEAWAALRHRRLPIDPALAAASSQRPGPQGWMRRWEEAAATIDPEALLLQHRAAGLSVLCRGDRDWPAAFEDDPDPPALLFVRGEVSLLDRRPAVAVVGTRRCSRYGLDVAAALGAGLAGVGVSVLSGLAAGIDGAAHRGALEAPAWAAPIGIVGSGLDVVYPRGHRQLWREVATAGALVSESPLGTEPARWRFPARNRLLAALADAVVVVESAVTGGAMHTVEEALRRSRPVLAVPGPVTSRSSTGTNRLLAEGALPACDVDDVLVAIGLGGTTVAPARPEPPGGAAGQLLDAFGWQPATLDQLVLRTGSSLASVARSLAELVASGWVAVDGGWYERCR